MELCLINTDYQLATNWMMQKKQYWIIFNQEFNVRIYTCKKVGLRIDRPSAYSANIVDKIALLKNCTYAFITCRFTCKSPNCAETR